MNSLLKITFNPKNKTLLVLYGISSIFRIILFYIGNESYSLITALTDYILLFVIYKNINKKVELWIILLIILMSVSEIFNRLDDIYTQLITYDITATTLWYILLVVHFYKKIKKNLSAYYFFAPLLFFLVTLFILTEMQIEMGVSTIPTIFNFTALIILGLFSHLNFVKGYSDRNFLYLVCVFLFLLADICFGFSQFLDIGEVFYIIYLVIYDVSQYLLIMLLANDSLKKNRTSQIIKK